METAINSPKVSFEDFYEVPNLKFDIEKLRADLDKFLRKKNLILQGLLTLEQYHLIRYLMMKIP